MIAFRNVMLVQIWCRRTCALGEARRDCFSRCNAGATVVQAHMWYVVTLGEARRDCFSQCNAGATVVQAHMWVEIPIEK